MDDRAWLHGLLRDLTSVHEGGFREPWRLEEAPPDYLDRMLAAVVGIEIEVTELAGKWKLSQNQPPANRAGVLTGLETAGHPDALAMAAMMRRREAQG